jgi:hypothetical protein
MTPLEVHKHVYFNRTIVFLTRTVCSLLAANIDSLIAWREVMIFVNEHLCATIKSNKMFCVINSILFPSNFRGQNHGQRAKSEKRNEKEADKDDERKEGGKV